MVTVAGAELPPELRAVMLYEVDDSKVGVPEMTHVDWSMDNPAGSDGSTLHAVTGAPFCCKVFGAMVVTLPK
jgi:hypothetical protein